MKAEIKAVTVTDDDGRVFTLSRYTRDGEPLDDREYALQDEDGNEVVVTAAVVGQVRAAIDMMAVPFAAAEEV